MEWETRADRARLCIRVTWKCVDAQHTTTSERKIKNESIHRFVATVGRLHRWYCRRRRRLSHSCIHPWMWTFNRRSECIRVCTDTRGAAKCNQANNERNGRAREAIKEQQWPATAHRMPPPPNSCSAVHFISERNTNFQRPHGEHSKSKSDAPHTNRRRKKNREKWTHLTRNELRACAAETNPDIVLGRLNHMPRHECLRQSVRRRIRQPLVSLVKLCKAFDSASRIRRPHRHKQLDFASIGTAQTHCNVCIIQLCEATANETTSSQSVLNNWTERLQVYVLLLFHFIQSVRYTFVLNAKPAKCLININKKYEKYAQCLSIH